MKIISKISSAILIGLFVWILASYIDIACHNTSNPIHYADWNAFTLLSEVFE